MSVLDQITRAIRASLDELLDEVDRLRRALGALTPGGGEPAARSGSAAEKPSTAAAAAKPRARTPPAAAIKPPAPARTAPGATKAAVLGALGSGEAMTAGEIAAATGLGRATISTTLTKLAGAGEIAKAPRGYQLKPPDDAAGVLDIPVESPADSVQLLDPVETEAPPEQGESEG